MAPQLEMSCRELNPEAAETVVFLHGGNVAGWMWEPQQEAVRDYHCLIPDLPGYGGSQEMEWESLAATAALLAGLVRERAHGGRAHVVGLSLGAVTGLQLAGRHPEVVLSGFLTGAPLVKPGPLAGLLAWFQMLAWDQPWFWKTAGRGYGLVGEDLEVFVQTARGVSKPNRERVFAEVFGSFPLDVLRAINAPLLLVTGGKDARLVRESAALAAREIPGVRTAVAPGMHHQWNIEDIGLFNRALGCWLAAREIHADLDSGVVNPRMLRR